MFALLKKEVRGFFSGPLAYLILFIFFAVNALVLFVLPTRFNLFDGGYSSLESYFEWLPLVFLFLIPALCMRSFSEERKSGTIEVLLTRPLSDFQVVMAKFLAGMLVLLISLLPTFLYLYTISSLAAPAGNFDMAAFWGAVMGIVFLGAAYTAICIYMSSLTENQVTSFVLSVVCCAVFYQGFELFGALSLEGNLALLLSRMGMRSHFLSLGRGVLDLKDLAYYLSLTVLFFSLTMIQLERRRGVSWKKYFWVWGGMVLFDFLVSVLPLRIDLTEDKRYTLMPVTKDILLADKEPVLVKVYLCGDLPAGFKRLEKSVRETLDEFRIYRPEIRYQFVDIYAIDNEDARNRLMQELAERGVSPTQLEVKTKEGVTRRLIFPGAEIRANGRSVAVSLLSPQLGRDASMTLNHSIENVELHLANAIRSLFDENPPKVAFLEGHGELTYRQTVSLGNQLSAYYKTTRVSIHSDLNSLLEKDSMGDWNTRYDVLIVAHPREPFPETDKLVLDQFVMYGGRILWLLDAGDASLDSLKGRAVYSAVPYDLRLEDQFFRYGFRLRSDIILDRKAAPGPVVTGYMGNQPLIEFLPNFYTPVSELESPGSVGNDAHKSKALSRLGLGVGNIRLEVAGGLDTIENTVEKTVLMKTSPYSHKVGLPHVMSAELMRDEIGLERFNDGAQMVGLLLEGEFSSAYPLVRPDVGGKMDFVFRQKSSGSSMIVFSDGNLASNQWSADGQTPFPLGFDRYTGQQYSNAELLMNGVHYLSGNDRWVELKPRTVKMRLLDKSSLLRLENYYRWLNLGLPLALCALAGGVFMYVRRYRYAKK